MAVPKKRTGHSAQGKRRSNWKATKPETTICSNCGQPVLAHTVCTACGYYKGEPVRLKDKAELAKSVTKPVKSTKSKTAEAGETPKKTTRKKSTKAKTEAKAEVVEEVVEETKETEVAEVKEETSEETAE